MSYTTMIYYFSLHSPIIRMLKISSMLLQNSILHIYDIHNDCFVLQVYKTILPGLHTQHTRWMDRCWKVLLQNIFIFIFIYSLRLFQWGLSYAPLPPCSFPIITFLWVPWLFLPVNNTPGKNLVAIFHNPALKWVYEKIRKIFIDKISHVFMFKKKTLDIQ